MEFLYPILSVIDKRLLLALAILLGVVAIIAILKRVFKVGVTLAFIAVLFMLLRPAVDLALEKYGLAIDSDKKAVTLTVDGKPYRLRLDELQTAMKDPRSQVEFIRQEASTTLVLKYYKSDGNAINESIPIPDFMRDTLLDILDKAGVKYKYSEYKQ